MKEILVRNGMVVGGIGQIGPELRSTVHKIAKLEKEVAAKREIICSLVNSGTSPHETEDGLAHVEDLKEKFDIRKGELELMSTFNNEVRIYNRSSSDLFNLNTAVIFNPEEVRDLVGILSEYVDEWRGPLKCPVYIRVIESFVI